MATKQIHHKRVLIIGNRNQHVEICLENKLCDNDDYNSNDIPVLQRVCWVTWRGHVLAIVRLFPNRDVYFTSKDPQVLLHLDLDAST